GGGRDRGGFAVKRQVGERRTAAVPDGRVLPRRPRGLDRPPRGRHRPGRPLLRRPPERTVPGAGRRRDPRRDPLRRLAGPPVADHRWAAAMTRSVWVVTGAR